MSGRLVGSAAFVAALLIGACGGDDPAGPGGGNGGGNGGGDPGDDWTLSLVAEGFDRPVALTAPDGDDRLFVVEQTGRIRIFANGGVRSAPFLDLSGEIASGGERGLLGLAFHPDYAANGRFFVNFTDPGGDTRVVEYTVGPDPDVADAASARLLLAVDQPAGNHNGGQLLFGPDGMLYIPLGDGGGSGDPGGNGQDRSTLLGSILRVSVDGAQPYEVPPDNPFVGEPAVRPEIWVFGVRNPWRNAFDRATGRLYVADVGQNRREEVTVLEAGAGGANLGWNAVEGTLCFATPDCDPSGFALPDVEYDHGEGCSITGGHVYRGSVVALRGLYFYSDFCEGWLRSFRYAAGEATERTEWTVPDLGNVTSFGEDGAGELHVLTRSSVYRLEARP